MSLPAPITSIETLPSELLEWLGERKIKPGDGDLWVPFLGIVPCLAPYEGLLVEEKWVNGVVEPCYALGGDAGRSGRA